MPCTECGSREGSTPDVVLESLVNCTNSYTSFCNFMIIFQAWHESYQEFCRAQPQPGRADTSPPEFRVQALNPRSRLRSTTSVNPWPGQQPRQSDCCTPDPSPTPHQPHTLTGTRTRQMHACDCSVMHTRVRQAPDLQGPVSCTSSQAGALLRPPPGLRLGSRVRSFAPACIAGATHRPLGW